MFWDSGRKFFAGILVSVSRIFVKKEKYLSRGFSWGKIIFLRNSFFKNAFLLLVRRLKFQLILPPGLSKLQSTYLEKFSGKRFSLKQNFHYYKYFGNLWTFGRFGEKKIFFFDRNFIRTSILGSELNCFGHFAYFWSAVCQNSISHNEEKLFTEKVFVVKVVQRLFSDFGDENLACLWTLQILVSSETFGQNFCLGNFFFRNECPTLSRTLSVVWPGTELFKLYSTGSVKLYQGNFFWKTFIFAFVLDIWRSTCSHSAETVCQGCQSCIVVGERSFVRRNIHFEENTIPCKNVSEFWEINFCRNSCECF